MASIESRYKQSTQVVKTYLSEKYNLYFSVNVEDYMSHKNHSYVIYDK